MKRISIKMLQDRCDYLNKVTNNPLNYCDKVGSVPFKANIGHYYLGQQYGGVSLEIVRSEGGGCDTIFHTTTKRELMALMNAFISGILNKEVA